MNETTYHLAPERGWLNDPNGMVRREGRWHVFFQHNPDAPVHDAIAWGHASSPDLARWELHPVAFTPTDGGPDATGCWSGCFLPGLEAPAVAYSGIAAEPPHSTVCVRLGSPDLMTWSGPRVVAQTPADVREMRDPFFFEHGGRRLAILGAGLEDGRPAVILFAVEDPWRWEYLGVWLTPASSPALAAAGPADVWECPQLVPVGDRWVLVLSLHDRGVLGQVVGCVGDLVENEKGDGPRGVPRFVADQVDLLDAGNCFYAPQVALDGGSSPWVMGWAREDGQDPAMRDRAGCMTLARRLVLRDGAARLVLDERAERLLAREDGVGVEGIVGEEIERADGSAGAELLQLGGAGRLTVLADAALRHAEHGTVRLGSGSQVWVDGDLVEVYPAPDATPSTWRSEVAWTLEVVQGGATRRPVGDDFAS